MSERARARYYSTRDIETILGVSRSTANQIMHMFEQRGKLLRFGNSMRVSIKDFEAWTAENTRRA